MTSRSAITAGRLPGFSRRCPERSDADDGPLGRAERAARRASGLGHRERTHQAHSGFRHQGADRAGGADQDGERGRPGAFRGRLSAVRPAAGQAAAPGRRDQPPATQVGRDMDDVGDHQRRHRCPHPCRTCGPRCSDNRFGELREGVWLRPDNLDTVLPDDVPNGCGCCTPATTTPSNSPPGSGTCRVGCASAIELLDEMSSAADVPARFVTAAAMVRHLLTDPVLPERTAARRLAGRGIA